MSEEERRIEASLDAERYRDLNALQDQDLHEEEELKRLHASIASSSAYNEVAPSYEEQYDPCEPTHDDVEKEQEDEEEEEEEDEKPFTAPTSLAVPAEMEIPATVKLNDVIERTAVFISKHGTQMEIVLKTKEAGNSQLNFLQFEHYLNPYYKHMVKRLLEGKYNPTANTDKKEDTDDTVEDSDSDSDGGEYLHPSFYASKRKPPEDQEKIKAIQTLDPSHPLSKLIKKKKADNAIRLLEQQARQAQLKREEIEKNSATNQPPKAVDHPLRSILDNSEAGINVETTASGGMELPLNVAGVDPTHILPPPPDLKIFIEDIAKRAALEGEELETHLLSSDSVNYCFLQSWNELNPYYKFRKLAWIQAYAPPPPPDNDIETSNGENEDEGEQKEEINEKNGPILFVIKTQPKVISKLQPNLNFLEEAHDDDEEEEGDIPIEQNTSTKVGIPVNEIKTDGDIDENGNSVRKDNVAATLPPHSDNQELKNGGTSVMKTVIKNISSHQESTTSMFVTSSGESASVVDLRAKQEARRKRAVMFKRQIEEQQPPPPPPPLFLRKGIKDIPKETAAAAAVVVVNGCEDIFDLSVNSHVAATTADKNDNGLLLPSDSSQAVKETNSPTAPTTNPLSSNNNNEEKKSVLGVLTESSYGSVVDNKDGKKRRKRRNSSSSDADTVKKSRKGDRKREKKHKKTSSRHHHHHSKSHKHKKRKAKDERKYHSSSSDDDTRQKKRAKKYHKDRVHGDKKGHKKEQIPCSDLSEGELRSD